MKKLVNAVVVLAVLGGLVAGCGGDDSSTSGTTTTGSGGDGSTTTSTDGGGSGGSDAGGLAGVLDKDCQFLLTGSYLNPLAAATQGKGDDVDNAADYLGEVADNAPDEIKDDLETVADAVGKVSEALKGVDLTDIQSLQDPEVQQKLQSLQGTFDSAEFEAASNNVSTWIQENCVGK